MLEKSIVAKKKNAEASAKEKLELALSSALMEKKVSSDFDFDSFITIELPGVKIQDGDEDSIIIIVDDYAFVVDIETLKIISLIGNKNDLPLPEIKDVSYKILELDTEDGKKETK